MSHSEYQLVFMNKISLTVVALLIISPFFWACTSGENTLKEAEDGVFAIHDEVMPKMGTIMKLQKQLKQRVAMLDSLKATGSAATTLRTGEEKEQAVRLSRDLTVADSLMMNWMSSYKSDTLAKLPSDEAMRYLSEQKEKISDVKTKVNTSIEQTNQFLDKK